MKRLSLLFAFVLALALCAPAGTQAQVLVDHSPPDHVNDFFSTGNQHIANPFSLASGATVGGLNFWGIFASGGPTASFVLNFYSSVAGLPGALLSSTTATITGVATGGVTQGVFPEYLFQTSLTPFALSPGAYFVSAYASSSDLFAWSTSSQTGQFAYSSTAAGPWSTQAGTMAFQITAPSAVPEGGSTSLLLSLSVLSLAGLVPLSRRPRHAR